MSKLPLVTFAVLQRVVLAKEYQLMRINGSHHIFKNPAGQTIAIPNHGSRVIGRALLRKILNQLGITIEEYLRLIK